MKQLILLLLVFLPVISFAQITEEEKENSLKIHQLIQEYSKARETKDTVLLQEILTEDMDQLVSNGTWRNGRKEALAGMMESSTQNPGSRTLEIEKIKFLSDEIAVVDCRYLISNQDGVAPHLWSSFVVVYHKGKWKISAIRNMNPGN